MLGQNVIPRQVGREEDIRQRPHRTVVHSLQVADQGVWAVVDIAEEEEAKVTIKVQVSRGQYQGGVEEEGRDLEKSGETSLNDNYWILIRILNHYNLL